MTEPLRVLLIEDSERDAKLIVNELRQNYDSVRLERVEDEPSMRAAIQSSDWDVMLSDWTMPCFSALAALKVRNGLGSDVPFIIVSGNVGEESAIAAMRAGAHDYILKEKLGRLAPAIARELVEHRERKQRREAEQRLRESEARFRAVVDSMGDIVFTMDHDQRHTGVFGVALGRFGINPEEFIGKTAKDMLGPEAALIHEEANARALRGERVQYSWTLEGREGGTKHFQTTLTPLSLDGQAAGVVGVARDITEQTRLQSQLMISDRMVSVGLLASGLAHEINNPLAVVIGNLELAAKDVASSGFKDELREELQDASQAAEKLRQIVRDLKLFSRIESESLGPVDVRSVMESSLRMAWNEIRHRARLVKDYQAIPLVHATASRLGQVFLNLVVNAAQAITEGRADSNEIRITTSKDATGHGVITIADTGAGMPPAVVARLFTPFFTTKPQGVGTGLGLTICQRLVTSFGGELTVESKVGNGTVFRITLPAASSIEAAETSLPAQVHVGRRGRILIVDDEASVCRTLQRILAGEHDVVALTSAREALARLTSGDQFDVLLCDVMMPEMTGIELHGALLDVAPEQAARMIFVTGGAFTPRATEFLRQTTALRIEKPFDAQHIRALVRERVR